ncbi:zinc finger protein 250-like [Triplophysa rosa]|uniref:Zinc finger protein 17-like n=1 Tax=Triplophysa rosa TaxID=992332 RepID=A0A9W7X624_TRIRA|nr:zinc finger protein 250-like [Triplophysa rosa]KAI7814359.1 putative zinc finger protein 17-like [Triplophysa rosa]
MVVMADVGALGVFQERVKTLLGSLLGSLLEVLLSEITDAYTESFPLNMSMKLCEKCTLNDPPENIKGDKYSGFRAGSEQSQPLKDLRYSDRVIPQQAISGGSNGQEVMNGALNQSDTPNRPCPPPVHQEAWVTKETKLALGMKLKNNDTTVTENEYVTPLIPKEGKEQEKVTPGVEYDADVKPVENEACEPARTKSSDQELSCFQSQNPACLGGAQGTSSELRERIRLCSVQLKTIPILERPSSQFYVCSFCSKIFMFGKTLRSHKRLHISERPYSCSHCHKSFNLRKTLLQHKKDHLKKLYSCTRCGKKYEHWRNLHLHWGCHAGRSPFLCFRCGKCCRTVLNRQSNLTK